MASAPTIYLQSFALLLFLVLALFTSEVQCFGIINIRKEYSFVLILHPYLDVSFFKKCKEVNISEEIGVSDSFKVCDQDHFIKLSHSRLGL